MDGYGVQRWDRALVLAAQLQLRIEIKGEDIRIYRSDGVLVGTHRDTDVALQFLFGYDWGMQSRWAGFEPEGGE